MKLRVLAIGKDRSGLYAPAVEEYAKRLTRYVRFELVELPEAKKHAGTPRAKEEEGAALLARLDPERARGGARRAREGATRASSSRAGWRAGRVRAATWRSSSVAPTGSPAEVLARAQEKLALSRFTLAHRLARLVLVEQLYRAMTIVRGEPYHK